MSFEGIANFRDIGGISTASGSIRAGRVFRSGQLSGATTRDLRQLRALGIGTVIDLRRPPERKAAPTADFGAEFIASDLDQRGEAPHVAFLRAGEQSTTAIDAYLLDYYRQAPFEPHNLALFGAMFAHLASPNRPLLVHCAAGKDRTGLAIAVLLSALGSTRDEIFEDFSRSNVSLVDRKSVTTARSELTRILGKSPSATALNAFLGVDARYLEAAFEAIEAALGWSDYLERIGVHVELLAQIRTHMII